MIWVLELGSTRDMPHLEELVLKDVLIMLRLVPLQIQHLAFVIVPILIKYSLAKKYW